MTAFYTLSIQNLTGYDINLSSNLLQRMCRFGSPVRVLYCSPVPSPLATVRPDMKLHIPSLIPVYGQLEPTVTPWEPPVDDLDWTEEIADFEKRYAEASGTTVEELRHYGRRGATCDCGDDLCDGFQMLLDAVVMHTSDQVLSSEHWYGKP